MLYISSNLKQYSEFKDLFKSLHPEYQLLDLSRVPSWKLVEECESILIHHSKCCVFLGYLEPGFMLELTHQTRIRRLFRKFPVGMVTNFVESLPFSWKNEIDTFYTELPLNKNGKANSVDNGSSIQEQSNI
jgi:hypothetical protein